MKLMRKILLGFMTLLMLTNVLTCDIAFCPMQSAQAAEPKPCHQSEEAQKDGQKTGPMFALDCMGVDLFQQDAQNNLVQPEQPQNQIDIAWAYLISHYNPLIGNSSIIRGPPFNTNPPHLNNHNLYLRTQRLRI